MGENQEHPSSLPRDGLGRVFMWLIEEKEFRLMDMPNAREAWEKGMATCRNPAGQVARPESDLRPQHHEVPFVLEE